nr:hypothetical protein [Marinicella sp. W31]MDC2877441.1 hypothetical protein [Marinicella sp. W31]
MKLATPFALLAIASSLAAGTALAKDKITVGVTPGAHEKSSKRFRSSPRNRALMSRSQPSAITSCPTRR